MLRSAHPSQTVAPRAPTAHGGSGRSAVGLVHWRLAGQPPRAAVPAAASQPDRLDTQTIDDLSTSYCDEFVCTSSPSVEAGVRAAAKVIQRANGKWGASQLASNVEYQDPVRRFRGAHGYARLDFVPSSVANPSVAITRMSMVDGMRAVIEWRLTGSVGPFPVDVRGTTRLTLNLLTGRIEAQREEWDLSACPLPGAVAWRAAAAAWAAARAGEDAVAGGQRVLDTLTSIDEDEVVRSPNPNDPMRFFQQRDTTRSDATLFMAVLALFWLLSKAYGSLPGF
eukprot:scaffold7.g3659.t1